MIKHTNLLNVLSNHALGPEEPGKLNPLTQCLCKCTDPAQAPLGARFEVLLGVAVAVP